MDALALSLYDEERRAKIEDLQSIIGQKLEVLFDRIQRRGAEYPPIAKAALSDWLEEFQAPTPEEMALFDELAIEDLRPASI